MIFETAKRIKECIKKVICGKDDAIDLLITALFCRGHILLEDVPGTGKTALASAAAKSVDCPFGRIQFTPDLLPSDITGINFYSQKNENFSFKKGPVFTGILLADEINRAAPRTQSALLECMEERQVTADGNTYDLPFPFMVIATQNPLESYGTFPLPEAQLDRFFISMELGYPEKEFEKQIIMGKKGRIKESEIMSAADENEIKKCIAEAEEVHTADCIVDYVLNIAAKTRNDNRFYLGISTRSCIDVIKASKAYAAISGRSYVIPNDIIRMLPAVTAHRILPENSDISNLKSKRELICEIISETEVPQENIWKF